VSSQKTRPEFHGTKVTNDGGLLAWWELDDARGLTSVVDLEIRDIRKGKNVQHGVLTSLRQAIYSRLAGYADINNAERLALDAAVRRIADAGLC
jgi:hypothetical protein